MENREKAATFVRKYISGNYSGVENMHIREMKYDTYTGNWTVHTSFNDINRSYEIAILFKDNKIIFIKEFV